MVSQGCFDGQVCDFLALGGSREEHVSLVVQGLFCCLDAVSSFYSYRYVVAGLYINSCRYSVYGNRVGVGMDIDELAKEIDPHSGWHVTASSAIRDEAGQCPVCHVANRIGLGKFYNADVRSAFEAICTVRIGISRDGFRDMIHAADNFTSYFKYLHYEEEQVRFKEVRERLLTVTGLLNTDADRDWRA